MYNASSFMRLSPSERVTHEWEILNDDGAFQISDLIIIGAGLLFFVLPGIIAIVNVITRPARKGYLCLTSQRCLYYERGEGTFITYHRIDTSNTDDIVFVHSSYDEGLGGARSLWIQIGTRNEEQLVITVGEGNRWLARIPLIGRLFQRNTIGSDALAAVPALYALVDEQRKSSPLSNSRF